MITLSLEASPRFGLGMRVLQTLALPLGYDAKVEAASSILVVRSMFGVIAKW